MRPLGIRRLGSGHLTANQSTQSTALRKTDEQTVEAERSAGALLQVTSFPESKAGDGKQQRSPAASSAPPEAPRPQRLFCLLLLLLSRRRRAWERTEVA